MIEAHTMDGGRELGIRQLLDVVVGHTARHRSAVVLVDSMKLTNVAHNTLKMLAELGRLVSRASPQADCIVARCGSRNSASVDC